MVGGGWRLAVGGWRSATGGWWRLVVVGGGWWLVIGGWWRLAVGGSWQLVAAGGWQRLLAGGWWRLVVGGWWRLAVDGSWRLAVGGPSGRSLRAVLSKKKKSGPLRTALVVVHGGESGCSFHDSPGLLSADDGLSYSTPTNDDFCFCKRLSFAAPRNGTCAAVHHPSPQGPAHPDHYTGLDVLASICCRTTGVQPVRCFLIPPLSNNSEHCCDPRLSLC